MVYCNNYQEPCPHQNHQQQVEPTLDHPRVKETYEEKKRVYNLAKRTQNLWKTWKRSLLVVHNDYVLGLLNWSDKKNSQSIGKKFWTYIKSKRKDNVGISSLNSGNTEITDNKAKAEILSNQFKAVLADEDVDTIPDMDSSGVSDIDPPEF